MNKLKHLLDACSIGGILSSVMGWLPQTLAMLASGLAIVWYILQMITWFKNRKEIKNVIKRNSNISS